jgi:Zn-dependent metalloprotease
MKLNPIQMSPQNNYMKTASCLCRQCQRNALHCFIPPYITDRLLENPDPAIREIARDNLTIGAGFRAVREVTPTRALSTLGTLTGGKYREVFDAGHLNGLPGKLVRAETGSATGDAAVDESYEGAGDTYDFFSAVFQRNSLDDHGLKLISSVHVRRNFNNAFWNGSQMAYGDGDGIIFRRFTRSLDVIGHELSHGVVSYTADLIYQEEPGALNEHFADVFGTLVKQWKLGQTVHQANWLLGENIVTAAPTRRGIRSMANPGSAFSGDPYLGTDPQPKHYSQRYTGTQDNGGVHINSGIPNHAFYLAAMALGGNAWATLGPIWYETLTTRLTQTSNFQDMRNATVSVAQSAGPAPYNAVLNAWQQVGL